MSASIGSWDEEYSEHSAWEIIASTIARIDEQDDQETDDAESEILARIRATLQIILEWKETPSLLISPQMLAALEGAVLDIQSELDRWLQTRSASNLNAALADLHTALEVTRGWPPTKDKSVRAATTILRQATQESERVLQLLRDTAEQVKGELEQELVSVKKNLDDRENEAVTNHQELETNIAKAQQSLEQIEAKGEQIDARLDTVLNTQQETFNKAEAGRLDRHQSHLESEQSEFQEALDAAVEQSREKLATQESSGQSVLARLDELKDEAEEVVGAVGTASTANWYETHANEQRKSADFWRWIATGLFAVAFGVVTYSAYIADHNDDSWKVTVIRATATATLVAGAVYAAKESTHHRGVEDRSRSTQLKLRALDPFIANLDEADRTKLKRDTATQIFIHDGMHDPNMPVADDAIEE